MVRPCTPYPQLIQTGIGVVDAPRICAAPSRWRASQWSQCGCWEAWSCTSGRWLRSHTHPHKHPKSEKHEETTSPSCYITVKLFHRTPTLEGSTNVEKFALQTGQTSSCVPTSQKWNWPKNSLFSISYTVHPVLKEDGRICISLFTRIIKSAKMTFC